MNRTLTLRQVPEVYFGEGSFHEVSKWLRRNQVERLFVVTSASNRRYADALTQDFPESFVESDIRSEPTRDLFLKILGRARLFRADAVAGLGGGSVLDVAKLAAALCSTTQELDDVFGNNLLALRTTRLICIPTTSGTGSEVSPNAILLDEWLKQKRAVISPSLIPDATFIDPKLMLSVSPEVTAATGADALSHCIEAYANRSSHPLVDAYALEGIRTIGSSLARAVTHSLDIEARESMAMGSLYGGLCLGPVNTAAVHALSYPLGSWFHVAHGKANALLLPYVMEFNLSAAPLRYRDIALALGVAPSGAPEDLAKAGVRRLRQMFEEAGLSFRLRDFLPSQEPIRRMAESALSVTRLMKNNLREMTPSDAQQIYEQAW